MKTDYSPIEAASSGAIRSPGFSQVLPDIYQIRLPLPFALRIVNCYLIRNAARWTFVDTGLCLPNAQAVWRAALAHFQIAPQAIEQIIVTHAHPDHYGMAGWLQQLATGANGAGTPPVRMSPREMEIARQIWSQDSQQPERLIRHFEQCGFPGDGSSRLAEEVRKLARATRPSPSSIHAIEPGSTLEIGPYAFQLIQTPGHSDGHLVLFEARRKFILCGDHVLLNITPNISIWPGGDSDPLGRYLASLRELIDLPVEIALPGHGDPIREWPDRIAALEQHHAVRLDEMAAAIADGMTVFEVCRRVFELQNLTVHEIRFALAETLAHLEYLVKLGELVRLEGTPWRYARR